MWEKSWERWRGWWGKSSASSWACWHFTHFVTFECWRLGGKPCRTFMSWLPNAGGKKKSSANQLGANYPDPGVPKEGQEDGFKPTNTSETLPGELNSGYWKTNRTDTSHSNMKQVCSDTLTYFYTSSVSCRKKCRFWEASLYTRKPQPASDNRP